MLRTDRRDNELWHKLYDAGDIVAGITYSGNGFLLAWSDWWSEKTFITTVDKERNVLRKRGVKGVVLLNMFDLAGKSSPLAREGKKYTSQSSRRVASSSGSRLMGRRPG